MPGIQNTLEFLDLFRAIGVAIARKVKEDGFQKSDLLAFLKSEEFEKAVEPAIKDANLVIPELQDLSWFEGIKLGRHSYDIVQDVLAELK